MKIKALKPDLKRVQLWLHHNYKQIRHWLVLILGVVLLIFSMVSVSNQNRLIEQVRDLSADNKTLNEQNKALSQGIKKTGENNQVIGEQIRAYSRCIAEIFARYTHDFIPITILNLDTCTIDGHEDLYQPKQSSPSPQPSPAETPRTNPGNGNPKKPDNPNKPTTPGPADNDGIVIDLPVLPRIHIPSPL